MATPEEEEYAKLLAAERAALKKNRRKKEKDPKPGDAAKSVAARIFSEENAAAVTGAGIELGRGALKFGAGVAEELPGLVTGAAASGGKVGPVGNFFRESGSELVDKRIDGVATSFLESEKLIPKEGEETFLEDAGFNLALAGSILLPASLAARGKGVASTAAKLKAAPKGKRKVPGLGGRGPIGLRAANFARRRAGEMLADLNAQPVQNALLEGGSVVGAAALKDAGTGGEIIGGVVGGGLAGIGLGLARSTARNIPSDPFQLRPAGAQTAAGRAVDGAGDIDEAAVGDVLRSLMEDPDLRARMARNAERLHRAGIDMRPALYSASGDAGAGGQMRDLIANSPAFRSRAAAERQSAMADVLRIALPEADDESGPLFLSRLISEEVDAELGKVYDEFDTMRAEAIGLMNNQIAKDLPLGGDGMSKAKAAMHVQKSIEQLNSKLNSRIADAYASIDFDEVNPYQPKHLIREVNKLLKQNEHIPGNTTELTKAAKTIIDKASGEGTAANARVTFKAMDELTRAANDILGDTNVSKVDQRAAGFLKKAIDRDLEDISSVPGTAAAQWKFARDLSSGIYQITRDSAMDRVVGRTPLRGAETFKAFWKPGAGENDSLHAVEDFYAMTERMRSGDVTMFQAADEAEGLLEEFVLADFERSVVRGVKPSGDPRTAAEGAKVFIDPALAREYLLNYEDALSAAPKIKLRLERVANKLDDVKSSAQDLVKRRDEYDKQILGAFLADEPDNVIKRLRSSGNQKRDSKIIAEVISFDNLKARRGNDSILTRSHADRAHRGMQEAIVDDMRSSNMLQEAKIQNRPNALDSGPLEINAKQLRSYVRSNQPMLEEFFGKEQIERWKILADAIDVFGRDLPVNPRPRVATAEPEKADVLRNVGEFGAAAVGALDPTGGAVAVSASGVLARRVRTAANILKQMSHRGGGAGATQFTTAGQRHAAEFMQQLLAKVPSVTATDLFQRALLDANVADDLLRVIPMEPKHMARWSRRMHTYLLDIEEDKKRQ